MNIFKAGLPSALFAVHFFLTCPQKTNGTGYFPMPFRIPFYPGFVFNLNLMTLPLRGLFLFWGIRILWWKQMIQVPVDRY
jgi:hypothetical protein